MLQEIRPAIVFVIALTLITGLVYPLAMTGIAGVIFPYQAQGSLIEKDGKVVGSALIGQVFAERQVFPRPAVGDHRARPEGFDQDRRAPYNAANSMGSNLGPTNKALIDRVKGDVDKLKEENPSAAVPIDLVTTSGSGLDPDISPEAALFQVPRVAKARNMPEDRVRQLVDEHIEGRSSACSASRASTCWRSTWRSTDRGQEIELGRLQRASEPRGDLMPDGGSAARPRPATLAGGPARSGPARGEPRSAS